MNVCVEQKERSLCEGNGGCMHLLFCEKSAFLLCAPETGVLPQKLAAHSKSTLTTPTTSEAPYSAPLIPHLIPSWPSISYTLRGGAGFISDFNTLETELLSFHFKLFTLTYKGIFAMYFAPF